MDYLNTYYASDIFSILTKVNINLSRVDVTILESSKVVLTDLNILVNLVYCCSKFEHKKSWFKMFLTAYTMIVMTAISIVSLAILFIFSEILLNTMKKDVYAIAMALEISVPKEYILSNGVTIHDSGLEAIQTFTKIVKEYFTIWTNQDFAKLPK